MLVGGGRRYLSEYIYSIVCVSAAIGIALSVSPEGGLKKHLRLICALCFLCVLIGPLTEIFDTVKNAFGAFDREITDENEGTEAKYEKIYSEYMEGGYGENVEKAVKDILGTRFGIPESEISAVVVFADKNGDGVKEVERITVILSGRSVFRDPAEIKVCVSETFACECLCAIE